MTDGTVTSINEVLDCPYERNPTEAEIKLLDLLTSEQRLSLANAVRNKRARGEHVSLFTLSMAIICLRVDRSRTTSKRTEKAAIPVLTVDDL